MNNKIEKALLGLVLIKPSVVASIVGKVNEENFYDKKNQAIFSIIKESYLNNEKLDILLLSKKLSKKYKGNSEASWLKILTDISIESGILSNLDEYIKILIEQNNIFNLEKALLNSLSDVKQGSKSSEELIQKIENDIFSFVKENKNNDFKKLDEIIDYYKENFEKQKLNDFTSGITTGIPYLDKITGGFKKGELTIIAGRPSMGKTAFAIQIMNNISLTNNVGFFSLEMPSNSIVQRFLSLDSGLNQNIFNQVKSIPQNKIEIIEKSLEKIKNKRIWIDDSTGLNVNDLIWKIRKLNSLEKLDIIFIDYLQLIENEKNNETRQQSISNISRRLKMIARELDIPVVSLSQLSRKVESREDKRPMMSDLRESGAIEQDADVIIMLYRPKYYLSDEQEEISTLEDLEAIVAKNRNGKTSTAKLDMNMEIGRITSKNMKGYLD